MRKSKPIQVLALLSSAMLLTVFLLYRVGKLDGYLAANTAELQAGNNSTVIASAKDTIKPLTDTQLLLLSSSKSMILIDRNKPFPDSLKPKPKVIYPFKAQSPSIMSSSKSAMIFELPVFYDSTTLKLSKLFIDTTKPKVKIKP